MLPIWNDSEPRELSPEERRTSSLVINVLAALLVIGLAIAAVLGGGDYYGLAVWAALVAWIPTVLVVGSLSEKYGWFGFTPSS